MEVSYPSTCPPPQVPSPIKPTPPHLPERAATSSSPGSPPSSTVNRSKSNHASTYPVDAEGRGPADGAGQLAHGHRREADGAVQAARGAAQPAGVQAVNRSQLLEALVLHSPFPAPAQASGGVGSNPGFLSEAA